MTRLLLCILILGGTVAFLSCSDSLDGDGGGAGKGGGGGKGGGSGGTTGGAGTSGVAGIHGDGIGPVAGRGGEWGGLDGTGPIGSDGIGPVGGRGGTTGVAGRGGTGGTGSCDDLGTGCGGSGVAGRGGTGGSNGCLGTGCGGSGGGGNLGPCDGLGFFLERGWCASTYAAQAAKQIPGNCDYVRVFTGTCGGEQVWTTRYTSLGDPVVCAYDGAGNLAGANICTDTNSAWNCNGTATSPNCLSYGSVPVIQACTLTTTCDATGGRGGTSAGDGAGPVGGRGGS